MTRIPQEELWRYRVEFRIEATALESDDQDSIAGINGQIIHTTEKDKRLHVGTVNGYLIQTSRMLERGEDIFNECDAHSQTLIDYISELLDPKTYEFLEKTNKAIGEPMSHDILILDLVEVRPEHRGFNLGLAGALRFIEMFGRGCGMVACKPFPLQFDISRQENQEWLTQMQMSRFTQEPKQA